MKTHKKVTYTICEDTIIFIDREVWKRFRRRAPMSKSAIVKNCLLQSFKLFESELVKYGKKEFEHTPKKIADTIPKTYTLPIEVVERLNYYSSMLGVKKSHLVLIAIQVVLDGW